MSFKRNVLASYVSQIYTALIGILIVPVYIQYMGAEAYGLIGFFTMLQAWFTLLDVGLTPTVSRETARYRGGSISPLFFCQLIRALTVIFAGLAIVGICILWGLSELISEKWLKVKELSLSDIDLAVKIMCFCVVLRWMGGLYRGVITGSERLAWLGGFNASIATLRFVVVLATMSMYGYSPVVFFLHQLVVALIEFVGLAFFAVRLLPARSDLNGSVGWSFKPVLSVLRFSLSVAFTSSVWVVVTQSDKLVLSGILSLGDYGYFSLAVLVASVIMIISSPISSAIMPRMAKLHAEDNAKELLAIYRKSTRLVSAIAGSVAITMAFCAEKLLFVWTGDEVLSEKAAPILRLYVLGNGLLAVGAFPYYLQYAKGTLRYHLIGNGLMVVFLIPSIVYAAIHYGAIGAGWAWFAVNFAYLFIWLSYVHRQLEPGLHFYWISKDVLLRFIPGVLVASGASLIHIDHNNRLMTFLYVAIVGSISILLSLFGEKLFEAARERISNNG